MITFDDLIEGHSGPTSRMIYSCGTTWWTHDVESDAMTSPSRRIPLDPSGCPLMQYGMLEALRAAEAAPEQYGDGGLDLFMFAHHQNCGGMCFKTWDDARAEWVKKGRPSFT